jgi:hypothetical protein
MPQNFMIAPFPWDWPVLPNKLRWPLPNSLVAAMKKAADQAAVNAMRRQLNLLDIAGVVVIGEGERDEAPMLYIGEEVGSGPGTCG